MDDELPVSFARWNLARQVKDILHENKYSEIRAEPIPRFTSRDQSPRIEYYGIDDLLDSKETSRRLLTVELGSVDVADRLPRGTDYTGTDSRNIVPFKMVHWHHDSLSKLNPRYQDSSSDEVEQDLMRRLQGTVNTYNNEAEVLWHSILSGKNFTAEPMNLGLAFNKEFELQTYLGSISTPKYGSEETARVIDDLFARDEGVTAGFTEHMGVIGLDYETD
jgi:hypothetical protein